jgi:hypothetical protein
MGSFLTRPATAPVTTRPLPPLPSAAPITAAVKAPVPAPAAAPVTTIKGGKRKSGRRTLKSKARKHRR